MMRISTIGNLKMLNNALDLLPKHTISLSDLPSHLCATVHMPRMCMRVAHMLHTSHR